MLGDVCQRCEQMTGDLKRLQAMYQRALNVIAELQDARREDRELFAKQLLMYRREPGDPV